MKLVFVSNYFNHHQKALAEEFIKIYGDDYKFIAFTPFNQKRLAIGYHDMNNAPFVLRAYENDNAMTQAQKLIMNAECVIVAGLPVSVVRERLSQGKITFMQSERLFKAPLWRDCVRFMKYSHYSGCRKHARNHDTKFYLLSAGKFAARDYGLCGLFRGKSYEWGYFPEVKYYDVDELISRKKHNSILWVGRFLDWKHPELAVKCAAKLKATHKKFTLRIIGSGDMQPILSSMIEREGLCDCVELSGALPAERVRDEMECAQIFLFTSDRGEGWGVVLNEAMNSACCVVSGDDIGSASYLVNDGQNGLLFRDRDAEDLARKVSGLLDDDERTSRLGRAAYETVSGLWSAGTAAKRFVELSWALRDNDEFRLWGEGPCS